MPRIKYRSINFRGNVREMIAQANEIIEAYSAKGFRLTLRQLYYQFVSRDLFPNTQQSYKKLGSAVNDGRLAGLIDWDAIEDRQRGVKVLASWDSPADIISSAARSFRIDKWAGQTYRPEVWVEKDALVGVMADVCNELQIPYLSCRGYTSQSTMWECAQRLQGIIDGEQTPIILHFGDHDPSGLDMTRDIRDRLSMFMGGTEVDRLALNMDQVRKYKPPPNPAKEADSRFEDYVRAYGKSCWELDALDPEKLAALVRKQVLALRDDTAWAKAEKAETKQRRVLTAMSRRFDDVSKFLGVR